MYRAIVSAAGTIQLGDQAKIAGYTPGAVVEVILTCTGTLMIAIDQSPPPIDVTYTPMVGGRAVMALRSERKRRRE